MHHIDSIQENVYIMIKYLIIGQHYENMLKLRLFAGS